MEPDKFNSENNYYDTNNVSKHPSLENNQRSIDKSLNDNIENDVHDNNNQKQESNVKNIQANENYLTNTANEAVDNDNQNEIKSVKQENDSQNKVTEINKIEIKNSNSNNQSNTNNSDLSNKNENNQQIIDKPLNDNIENENVLTSPLQTNTDSEIQSIDQKNDNQDHNKTKSNSENSTIVKDDDKNIDCKSEIKTADDKDQSKIINNPPIGLPNPSSYCYLNSILQTLFSCQNFQDKIIEFYQNNKSINCDNANKKFVVSLGDLFCQMKEGNKNEAENAVKRLHDHFDRTIYGDDIHKCYLQILRKINDEIKTVPGSDIKSTINNLADKQFEIYRKKDYGFIFDLFCGQLSFKQKCKTCSKEFNEKFQLFKSMPLQIPFTNSKINECIEGFFEESRIDGANCKNCNEDLFSISEITHSPQFIFIYLVRGAYSLSESKNNTIIQFDNYINIPTMKGNVLYKLRSVIDHLGGNESGHYFMKTLSGSDWYLLNDVQVRKINSTNVPTKHSIGLLIEKVINFDENFPEPLIDYDTKCFYQNRFQSILQIFYQCSDIRQYFIDIFTKRNTNKNLTDNLDFQETLGQLFHNMRNMNKQEIRNDFYQTVENSLDKNDIYECFLQLLKKINVEIKSTRENTSENYNKTNLSADEQFLIYKNNNDEVSFDHFSGKTLYETKCGNKECNKVFNKSYQLLSSIKPTIQKCQFCDEQEIINISPIIHSSQFVFIYLIRGNNKFDNYINIPTVNGNVLYKLRSVIDRSNDNNTSRRYSVKMLIKSTWWLKKDYRMKKVIPKSAPTNLSVGLLFEKVTSINHNIPESLLIDKYAYQKKLECIVEFLFLCCDSRKHLIDFYTNEDTNENIIRQYHMKISYFIFKRKIGEMMVLLDKNETDKIEKLMKEILNFLPNKIESIDQLYCCIMDKLNDQTITINEHTNQQSAIAEPDLFGEQISMNLKCILSEKIFQEGITAFKSITIHEPATQQNFTIFECIENLLENSKNNECNDKQQIISINQLTHSPQFIFIYLVRKSNKFMEFNNYINVPTVNGNVLYKLRYVIDHIGGIKSTRYVVKTLTDSNWLEKEDNNSKKLHPTNVPTGNSIGFLIEKVTDINHNVPETLLQDNYSSQEALQSIIQMLYLCVDIRQCLIEFYTNDHSNENITENLIFKKKIGEIMFFLKNENESGRIKKLFAEASNFLPNKRIDIHELYLCVVNKLNEKGTQINSNVEYNDSLDESGYKRSRIHCENCTNYSVKISQPQIFKSLYLKSQNNKLNLSKRIESFCKSQLNCNDDPEKCCNNPKIVVVEEILSAPKYLFIYLESFEGNVEDNKEIILNTQSGTGRYFLFSLLNYTIINNNNGQTIGKFSVRKFESNSIPNPNNESIIAVMMVRGVENISISNTENNRRCGIDMKTKDSSDSTPDVNDNLINQYNSLHKNDYHLNISKTIDEEKLESDFIAQSIKQIIELNKNNKIHVLLGLLFSCTPFRNFLMNLYNINQIKKVFKKILLFEAGIFFNNVCILYDQVIERKRNSSMIKSDNNWNINQCFDFIFGSIKMIAESKEFSKIIDSSKYFNSNFINDNFFGIILLEGICNNCSKSSKYEDSFSNLCVKKPQKGSSNSLEKCLINYGFEEDYQQEEKCCRNAKFFLTRKIIHAPPILFICFDEKLGNINPNCFVSCDFILKIDTTNGPVAYSPISLIDRNAQNIYDVKFLGNSDWWQTYPKPRKLNMSEIFTKYTVGFLFKKLE